MPDVTYAEGHYGWLSPHAPCFCFTAVRSPAIEPLTDKTSDGRPICLETFLIDLAKVLGLPGFGEKAIPGNNGWRYPLEKAEDFYLRAFSNIAKTADVPAANAEVLSFVETNYPVAKYKKTIKQDEWVKVANLLSRGGIFGSYEESFNGNVKRKAVERFCLYNEILSSTICSVTGKKFSGTVCLDKRKKARSPRFPFNLVSFKKALHTQSRSVWHKMALKLWPENFVYINKMDANQLGLKHMEMVKVSSPFNKKGIKGRLFVTDTVRQGVVAISISYGHSQLGASPIYVKGMPWYQKADKRLGTGINPNDLSLLVEQFKNTPLVDYLGGIPDFSSSIVRIEKL